MTGPRPLLLVLALSAPLASCREEAPMSVETATLSVEAGTEVHRLLDHWPEVRAAESPALEIDALPWVEARAEHPHDAGDGWVYHPQPWPSADGRVRSEGEWCGPDAAGVGARVPCYVPSARRFEAASLLSDGERRPRFQDRPETWNLAPGQRVGTTMELPVGQGAIEVVVRALQGKSAQLEVQVAGKSIGRIVVTGPGWLQRELRGDWSPGRHEVAVIVHGEGPLRVVQVASIGRRLPALDHVLLPASEGPVRRWSCPPRAAHLEERLPSIEVDGRSRAWVLALGGKMRVEFPEAVSGLEVDGVAGGAEPRERIEIEPPPGLVELTWSGPAVTPTAHQPIARVREQILDPETELLEDLAASVDGGPLPGTMQPRFLRRLECRFDRRVALFLPTPGWLEWSVRLDPGDLVRFSTGRPTGLAMPESSAVRARVHWRPESGHEVELCSEALGSREPWGDREWKVPPGHGGRGVLRFETAGPDAALAAFADPRVVRVTTPEPRRPNLILYVIDTLRADALSCYGNHNPTSPELDAIAAKSYRFEHCYSVSSWTRPAIGTMMTGLYPPYHGILSSARPLPQDMLTLAELLRSEGYGTSAVVTNVQVDARGVHFEQGFHRFLASRGLGIERPEFQDTPSSRRVGEIAREWLSTHGDEPHFLYLHSMDPHMPYLPPEETRRCFDPDYSGPLANVPLTDARVLWNRIDDLGERDFQFVRNVYDAEVRSQDEQIGALWRWLDQSGQLEDTIVAFVSDHGEEFYEHQSFSHQGRMWELHLRVPWIVWVPPRLREGWALSPGVIEDRVSLVDLFPTLVSMMGVQDPVARQGRDLVASVLHGRAAEESSPLYAQESLGLSTIIDGPWKLIRRDKNDQVTLQLYNLEEDPGEQDELGAKRPAVLERMLDLWTAFNEQLDSGPHESRRDSEERVQFRGEDAERLRALGYLDATDGGGSRTPEEEDG